MTTKPPTASHRVFSVAGIALAAMLACAPAQAQPVSSGTEAYASGRILIMPRAGLSDRALANVLKERGGGKARRVGNSNLRIVDLPPGLERAMVQRLSRHPHIKFAELDRVIPHDSVSNDPYLGSQWHLPKIGANLAWEHVQGSGVILAILDSGIDTRHPDVSDRLVAGYNFVDRNTNVEDVKDHGTKVAGSAAATLNNGVGVASVAGQAKIMPIRVSDSAGYATWSAIASGLTWAADRGARVANISFNGAAGSSSVLSAARYLKSKGGLVFVSAGNSNLDPGYANTSDVIIVAATNRSDNKASFSNFGDHVHLSAPGDGIYTTTWRQGYASVSGTSFSAPITAGVAALVMAANPALTNSEVEQILFSTAVDLGAPGRDSIYGHGRVDAGAAVAMALASGMPQVDSQEPTVAIQAPLGSATVNGLVPVDVAAADNFGVSKVELLVNGAVVATDTAEPYGFSWDSTRVANGMASLLARAYDAAGNVGQSTTVAVNVANAAAVSPTPADTTPPSVTFSNPRDGSTVSGTVKVSVGVSDDSGSAGLSNELYIGTKRVATSTGGSLSYSWNVRRLKSGSYTLRAVSKDAAGNTSSVSVTVKR